MRLVHLLREILHGQTMESAAHAYDQEGGQHCRERNASRGLREGPCVSKTGTALGVLISACILVSFCGLVGYHISVGCDPYGSGRYGSEGAETSAIASTGCCKLAATPAWASVGTLSSGWTNRHCQASGTNRTSHQSSPEVQRPSSLSAPSKPAPALVSWSPLQPNWLQGLSLLEAVALLLSEARIILTPVQKARFVVSLTTSPRRVGFLEPVLKSLQQNSLKPDLIIVNLPFVFLRDGSKFGRLPTFLTSDPGVLVNWCEDVGPATKVLGALPLLRGLDDVIVSVDDDIWYPRHHLKKLYLKFLENPESIVTGKSALPGFMVEGFSGVVYRRRFFGDPGTLGSWLKAAPTSCFLADDFVLSNYLLNRRLSFVTCNTRYEGRLLRRLGLGPLALEHGLKSDALHLGANHLSRGNAENYAICRRFLESEGSLISGFPNTSSVYYDGGTYPS